MFLSPRYRTAACRAEFQQGCRDTAGAALGIAAWGLMTGVAMIKSGLSLLESVLMSVLVFAGSAQLTATPLILSGAPMWVIFFAAFCVNLRFVVFSAHLRPYVGDLGLWQRLHWGYWTGDVPYVLFAKRHEHPAATAQERDRQLAYLAGATAIMVPAWHVSSLLGIFLAHQIPTSWGLGFAGVLALLGVLAAMLHSPLRWLAFVVSASAAVAAYAMPLRLNIVVAIAAAVLLCMVVEQWREKAPPRQES